MVVQHNIMALNSYNKLGANNSLLAKNLEKLSSGYKINRAGDDAAGLAISEKMRAQIANLDQATDNAQDAISVVQVAEGALAEVHSMLTRMSELATQASNSIYEEKELNNIKAEIDALTSEIDRISDTTNFNGLKLLNGDFSGKMFQVGATSATADRITVTIKDMDSTALTVNGVAAKVVNGGADAAGEIDTIKAAIEAVSTQRADLGAIQNRLEHTITNLNTTTENLTASESRIRDTDMAEEMMKYTKNNVLAQAAQAMLAQANQQPQMVLQLLQ